MKVNPLTLLFFLASTAPALSVAQTLQDTLRSIDALFSKVNEHTPGISLLISRGGNVIYHKNKGLANLELAIPITNNTRIEAGSVSKQFTATAILLLVRKGEIALDDEVRKYIPELPDYGAPITIRHLLNHTSGLKDWGVLAALGGWPRGTRVYTNELALKIISKQPTLNNRPGEEYLYSNSNYTLLALVVERIVGKSLAEFTEEYIFRPLNMLSTSWRTNFQEIVSNRATGYSLQNGDYRMDMPFENTYGHAALLTTVADLDKWNTSWKDSPLGGQPLLNLRTQRGVLNSGDTIAYAGGVSVGTYNGRQLISHHGFTAGYKSFLCYFPETSLSIVFLSNDASLSTNALADSIISKFFGMRGPKVAEQKKAVTKSVYKVELDEFQGCYESDECDGRYKVTTADSTQLQVTSYSNRTQLLKPIADDTFETDGEATVHFRRDVENNITGFLISVPRARNVWFERVVD